MFAAPIRALAPLALLLSSTVALAQADPPVTPAELMRHIERLASDEFEGRAPATEGERRTTAYIVEQLRSHGLEPAGANDSWFQPVPLVERAAGEHAVQWTANGRPAEFSQDEIVLLGRDASQRIADAPVIFAGHGARIPDRGIDQLAGTDVRGAVVLVLLEGPNIEGFPSLAERRQAVSDAGAAAVIAIVGAEVPWEAVRTTMAGQRATRLDSTPVPEVTGAMPLAAAQRLIAAGGGDLERLMNEQPGSSFRAVTLPLRATIDVTTRVERYVSNNVVARLRGSGNTNENLLYLAHWDHLGVCRPEGEADRICNGAVDNASGIAALIEIAGRLARQPRPARDILFLATTAEESGLLGAEYFAAHPVAPAPSIVAAINMDTIAIAPAGAPVAVMGRGDPALDRVIDETIQAAGRQIDTDDEANALVQRQDGWELTQAGIPTIMVGGSFSNMELLGAFLNGAYHKPEDQLGGPIPLEGAAEDTNLMVALGRRLADPTVYRRPAATTAAGQD
ncbi:M28 family peptidase [Sphingosinicella sp. LHD-64]|uniref:M28 family peptidase n=1 Tax=Sphingosinicella sp. LHD-64 TaxID=3072139 RepID=UPI00280CC4CB|nr:M28 family peptidase [Sphingosinicella sp. LHD-64]MDQ8755007.1 M28 family peptidase [Sphingosinicella sp. LHD-64]